MLHSYLSLITTRLLVSVILKKKRSNAKTVTRLLFDDELLLEDVEYQNPVTEREGPVPRKRCSSGQHFYSVPT